VLEPASRVFLCQRQRLHYADWGNPDAPPLILLHGGRDHCRSWDWVAQELRHQFHILAPDIRGHGDSCWSSNGLYTMSGFIYDFAELVRHLGHGRVAIVGHSLGGNIALRYAGTYPEHVSKIVAIEGLGASPKTVAERQGIPAGDLLRGWIDARRALSNRPRRRYDSLEAAADRMRAVNKRLTPEQAAHLTRHGMIRNEDNSFSWKFDDYVVAFPPNEIGLAQPRDLWASIGCPTLLIHGKESWASDPLADGSATYFRHAQVLLMEGAGHWVQHDRKDAVVAALRDFL
jgi:pimeloyl-ACP methyl ester carboxylesterase